MSEGSDPIELVPVPASQGEGAFDTVADSTGAFVQTQSSTGAGFGRFLYLQAPPGAALSAGTPSWVQVTYRDRGFGVVSLEYDTGTAGNAHQPAEGGMGDILAATGRLRTAVWETPGLQLRHAQNLNADLRLVRSSPDDPLEIISAQLWQTPPPKWQERASGPRFAPYNGESRNDIDPNGLRGKTLCGYQGWFRTPGDSWDWGWWHWCRDRESVTPAGLTVDLWPDLSEASDDEKFYTSGYQEADGTPAALYSSLHPQTVERHFEWMRQYGLDGVWVQRFVNALTDDAASANQARALVLARDAAHRSGRVWAVEYDLTGTDLEDAIARIQRDWQYLTDTLKPADDTRYVHEQGRPVLAVFGFYTERFSGADANRLIDLLESLPGKPFIVGSGQHTWRQETNPEWARAFRRFGAIKPWNLGNVTEQDGIKTAITAHWAEDREEAEAHGMIYLPTIYPGFTWVNLFGREENSIARRGGDFFREQARALVQAGIGQAFVAMFDEVDEGTAIFKVRDTPPNGGFLAGLEGKPSDHYLRLTGELTQLLRAVARGETPELPLLGNTAEADDQGRSAPA